MDVTWAPYPLDSVRATTVFVHSASPLDVLQGASLDPIEITQFCASVKQSPGEVSVGLAWHDELYGANQPKYGQILEIRLEGRSFWIGIIQSVNDYRLSSGQKSMTIVARSRDATPLWRETRRLTDIYPVSTPLDYIARQICYGIGITDVEIDALNIPGYTVHSNTQLADLPPWQMFTVLMQPSGLEPYVDARGRLKAISRDTARAADIELTDNTRLLNVNGSKSRSPVTEVKIRWLDPNLTEVSQQDRILDKATMTAGFFKLKLERDVTFSRDGTQRARNTHMVVRQSANAGLLPVCSEDYSQKSITSGQIVLTTSAWVPTLATACIANKVVASYIGDLVVSFGGGYTVPVGRPIEGAADVVLFLTMMSIGTGVYEIWGTPYDMVHTRNTTTAYGKAVQDWEINVAEIENDFVMNQQQSEGFAVRELIYSYRSASSYNVSIVDDPRIERGDIIALKDGSRVYVTDYTRDLSFGAPATLDITGFRC
jgi:hypothetical protein